MDRISNTTYLGDIEPPDPIEYPIEYFNWMRVNRVDEPAMYFLTGPAGTGKTFSVLSALERNPTIAKLTASTGKAAVNLGIGMTIHSLLHVFNEASLEDAHGKGRVQTILRKLRDVYSLLIIDEGGMLNDRFVGALFMALEEINGDTDAPRLGLVFVLDFAQLAPIPYDQVVNGEVVINPRTGGKKKQNKIPWMFNNIEIADVMRLPGHYVKLTEIKRQSDVTFIEGLNALRVGDGLRGATLLKKAGVNFVSTPNPDFDGTSFLAVNEEVARYNRMRLLKFDPTQRIQTIPSYRWWAPAYPNAKYPWPKDWETIPEKLELKIGAYVMLLRNIYDINDEGERVLIAANGDTGTVEEIIAYPTNLTKYKDATEEELREAISKGLVTMDTIRPKHTYLTPFADIMSHTYAVKVRIQRKTGSYTIMVSSIVRDIVSVTDPNDTQRSHERFPRDIDGKPTKVPVGTDGDKVWIVGQILYHPLTLAWYSTTHKGQGLTCDRVQVNLSHPFFKQPAMAYTAVSRCRTPEGLYIVGSPTDLAAKTNASKEIMEWI